MIDYPAEVMQLWHQVNQEMHERLRQVFLELKLPPLAPILLQEVCEKPGITVSELARRTDIAKSHVSRMLDTMTADGCLTKQSDPQDQRLVRVYPTDLAAERLKELNTRLAASWAEATAGLTTAEVESVISGLQTLLSALQRTRTKEK